MNSPSINTQKAFLKLVADAKTRIREVTVNELSTREDRAKTLLVDVREESEWNTGRAEGAIHLSRGVIEQKIGEVAPDPNARIVCYCGAGNRSALVTDNLQKLGYTNVASLIDGFGAWRKAGLPVSTNAPE